jgi:glycosyltransferase involved in cell wall biosynthesis
VPRRPQVAWVASAFGFGDDLAYFTQVFGAYVRSLPGAVVLVRADFPVERYPDLPLAPVLDFWVVRIRDTLASGAVYEGLRRFPRPRTLGVLWRLRAQTLIVTEFTPITMVAWLAGRVRGSRTVLLIESDPAFRGGETSGMSRVIKSFVARHSHAVLTSNRLGAAFCREALRVPSDRLVVGPYLTSALDGVSPPPAIAPGKGIRLLFLNSLNERKGLSQLLRALAEPAVSASAWHLDVVGSGPSEQDLRGLVTELSLSERVTFHGRVPHDQVAGHYSRCHVVVCPSLGDYRSLAGFEAVNARRPVLVSSRDGAADELRAALPDSVVVVDPLDHSALVDAVRKLTDPSWVASAIDAAAAPPSVFSVDAVGEHLAAAVSVASKLE